MPLKAAFDIKYKEWTGRWCIKMLAPGIPFKYLDATMAFFLNKKFNGMLILISLSSTGKMQRKRKRHQFKLP